MGARRGVNSGAWSDRGCLGVLGGGGGGQTAPEAMALLGGQRAGPSLNALGGEQAGLGRRVVSDQEEAVTAIGTDELPLDLLVEALPLAGGIASQGSMAEWTAQGVSLFVEHGAGAPSLPAALDQDSQPLPADGEGGRSYGAQRTGVVAHGGGSATVDPGQGVPQADVPNR